MYEHFWEKRWLFTENAEEDVITDTKTIAKEANLVAKKHKESGWWEEPGFLEGVLAQNHQEGQIRRQTACKASWSL